VCEIIKYIAVRITLQTYLPYSQNPYLWKLMTNGTFIIQTVGSI